MGSIIGPPAKRHSSGRWPNNECWLGSFVIFQGIGTSIAKKPYIIVIFQGGWGSDPLSPPLWIGPCIYLLVSSADTICDQFGPRSGPTKSRALSGPKLFETLMVFPKAFFEKVDFEKNQRKENYLVGKE